MKSNAYNEANSNAWVSESNSFFQEDPYPYNQYTPPGMVEDDADKLNPSANRQRDGSEFDEFRAFKRKKRLRRLKSLLNMKKKKQDVFQPTPFYSSMYGYTGFEGAMTSPLEYYSGSISEEPGAITNNPYNNSYQGGSFSGASVKNERILIRAMIFNDYISKM